jgi:hypothetical protein
MTVICPACGASVSVVNGIEKPHNSKCYMELCASAPPVDDDEDDPDDYDSGYPYLA